MLYFNCKSIFRKKMNFMNLDLPKNEKIPKRTIAVYITAILICVIALVVAMYFFLSDKEEDNKLKLISKTIEEENELKANFENLFNCNLENKDNYEVDKKEKDKDIIYTKYSNSEKSDNDYDIHTQIPYININSSLIDGYNKQIEQIFQTKVDSVLNTKNQNIVYTVKYQAYIEKNILSLMIYSDLKQSSSPQRVIVQTLNFDLENYKELSLEDMIKIYGLDKNAVQNKINKDIKQEQDKAEDLISLGYEVFSRNLNSDMYKIDNSKEFFVHNNNLYIIYAYGNEGLTREIDIVVI